MEHWEGGSIGRVGTFGVVALGGWNIGGGSIGRVEHWGGGSIKKVEHWEW